MLFVVGPMATERTGLRRQVFPDVGFSGAPVLSDVAADIALDFLNDDPLLPRRAFSVRWTGFWYLPEAGEFEFHGAGDDRLDVWLDGELVIRRQPPADMHTLVRRVRLDAGIHELRAEYEQHGGAFNLSLEWSPVAGEPRPLPAAMLFPQRPDDRELQLARTDAVLRSVVPVVWLFPLGIALVILARPLASRIYAAVVVASGLELYPLGAGRTDIFTFPVGILLFTAGVWCVTDALRRSSAIRLFAAALASFRRRA